MALTNEEKKAYAIQYLDEFVSEIFDGNKRTLSDLYDFMLLSAPDKIDAIRTDFIDKKKVSLQKALDGQVGNKIKWEEELAKLNEY